MSRLLVAVVCLATVLDAPRAAFAQEITSYTADKPITLLLNTPSGPRLTNANIAITLDIAPPVGDSALVTFEFASILSESTVVMGHDTGPMSF